MKFTFDDKLKAVLYYLKYGSYEIPDDYASRTKSVDTDPLFATGSLYTD